jgi:molecular chaperone HtpG
MTTATAPLEKLEFKTELKQLLHIITHSLYSHREIFLRELISNASDALNKIKFDALAHEELLEDNKDWKIKIIPDAESNTLTISDNGIGMSREGVIDQLGTIAKSGTRAYLEHLRQQNAASRPDLIGQFGVGFYSAFMVADKVTVITRQAGDPKHGVRWESDGQGEFSVEPVEKPARGTDVILHLKDDAKEFLDSWRLRELVKKFSNFIEHPVVMDVEKASEASDGPGEGEKKETVEETLNARAAIWLRPKKEVTAEEYTEFYRQIAGGMDEPARVIHYSAEGQQEYKVLLFIPSQRPFEMDWGGELKIGPRLYIQRVLIMENCETLLPPYLRFVKGVVDSSDLPLNISREILQQNPLLERIQKDLVRSVLKELGAMKEDEFDKYLSFYKALGDVLKEGVSRDWTNREKVADLLLFESMKTEAGKYTTLEKYVEAMPADQKEIFFLIGDSRMQIENSPYLEVFRTRGQDVLLLTDSIDEFVVSALREYKGKTLKGVDRGELDQEKSDEQKAKEEQFKTLLEFCKKTLPEVSDVRLSRRLKESAACLVAADGGVTAHMERLMHRMGREDLGDASKRVLELNADHLAVAALRELQERTPDDARLESHVRLLYDQAVIAEGSKVKDPAALARRINELLTRDARGA